MLASSSQDNKVRLWKITSDTQQQQQKQEEEEGDDASVVDAITKLRLQSKGHIFKFHEAHYVVLLEAVLTAHHNWAMQV